MPDDYDIQKKVHLSIRKAGKITGELELFYQGGVLNYYFNNY
jgi:hypothetical protein